MTPPPSVRNRVKILQNPNDKTPEDNQNHEILLKHQWDTEKPKTLLNQS